MIDSGSTTDWTPSQFIQHTLRRQRLDYLFITNADQDHMSGLQGLWDAGIGVGVLHRNRSYTGAQMREIKQRSGPLTTDAQRYVAMCDTYVAPVTESFDDFMGGIKAYSYWNPYPQFTETNDLSLAVFVEFGGFKILFPGDLEKPGWKALLQRPEFRDHLSGTTMLVASHHGRESGYCDEVLVRTTGRSRHVLTTRRDGWIQLRVNSDGSFAIDTECQG
jgi:beta-lactamase superfamily II metal-dependent hydrolase